MTMTADRSGDCRTTFAANLKTVAAWSFDCAAEYSCELVGFAQRNAERLGLAERARFLRGNWGESLNARFDLIFVNPPYVKSSDIPTLAPEVALHEPATALDGGKDGLEAYRRIAPALREFLSPSGCAFVEIGEGQAEAVAAIVTNATLVIDGTVTDLARILRCLVVMVAPEQHSRANRKKQL